MVKYIKLRFNNLIPVIKPLISFTLKLNAYQLDNKESQRWEKKI